MEVDNLALLTRFIVDALEQRFDREPIVSIKKRIDGSIYSITIKTGVHYIIIKPQVDGYTISYMNLEIRRELMFQLMAEPSLNTYTFEELSNYLVDHYSKKFLREFLFDSIDEAYRFIPYFVKYVIGNPPTLL